MDVMMHPWFSGVDWRSLEKRQIRAPIIPRLSDMGSSSTLSAVMSEKRVLTRSSPGDTQNFQKYPLPRAEDLPGLFQFPPAAPPQDVFGHLFEVGIHSSSLLFTLAYPVSLPPSTRTSESSVYSPVVPAACHFVSVASPHIPSPLCPVDIVHPSYFVTFPVELITLSSLVLLPPSAPLLILPFSERARSLLLFSNKPPLAWLFRSEIRTFG